MNRPFKVLSSVLVALAALTGCIPQLTGLTETLAPAVEATRAAQAEPTPTPWPRADERDAMVDIQIEARGVVDSDVLRAMRTVPRHEFVPMEYQGQAYNDHPLPIGYGQTISQPFVVAWMTEALDLTPGERVLEIGAGSGYQAAVLAEVVDDVYTIEIVGALAERATEDFRRLGYDTINVKHADGYFGWEEYAPFDAIIVTAAPDHVPQPLLNQLADSGRLVIPVGPPGGYQSLWLYTREGDNFTALNLGGVRFVPFTREVRGE
ncbi:MAG: protein-L-isoaspartate(D-aspartate) O-methyltransferase [Anaerolineae bacterium]|nr:protein-L-isoaspartate(D-aspartate) O-methyltransferase [Anaerolineae bacterium]